MSSNSPENFAKSQKALIVAPAGCGKTELIADSVSHCDGLQLILTHTHAGVNSLRKRLKKKGVSSGLYRLETIHSFALRYASAYPKASGLITSKPKTTQEYENVITSAVKLFETELAKTIFNISYTGVFVDEYQDCTVEQHKLIMALAENLPCRIVGDPLQGIFDFGKSELVNWESDVFPSFDRLDDLHEPWRWKGEGCNELLGKWLIEVARPEIEKEHRFKLGGLEEVGVYWHPKSKNYSAELQNIANNFDEIFAICDPSIEAKPHHLAKKLKNRYKTIEPLTSKKLMEIADKLVLCHF